MKKVRNMVNGFPMATQAQDQVGERVSASGKERSCESGERTQRRERPTSSEKGKVAFPRPHDLFWL